MWILHSQDCESFAFASYNVQIWTRRLALNFKHAGQTIEVRRWRNNHPGKGRVRQEGGGLR